jgi:hypothetical protein
MVKTSYKCSILRMICDTISIILTLRASLNKELLTTLFHENKIVITQELSVYACPSPSKRSFSIASI